MRFVSRCVLWALGAVLCTALVIGLLEGYSLVQAGEALTPASGQRLLTALGDHLEVLGYAALAGVVIGIACAIPGIIRRNAERLLAWTAFGAVSGAFSVACGVFLYKGSVLQRSGVRADQFSFLELVAREMRIQDFLPYGAIAGAAIALFMMVTALLRESTADQIAASRYDFGPDDPDTMIRSQRARRARQYLAEREQQNSGMPQP